jgi:hypothetical protein
MYETRPYRARDLSVNMSSFQAAGIALVVAHAVGQTWGKAGLDGVPALPLLLQKLASAQKRSGLIIFAKSGLSYHIHQPLLSKLPQQLSSKQKQQHQVQKSAAFAW